jgi:hypothetical protein
MPVDKNVTFRPVISGEIADFLKEEGFECAATASAIVAIAARLTSLKEEGQPLSPEIFFCLSVEKLSGVLQGAEVIKLGEDSRSDKTVLRALKECAPLASGGWVIFVERTETNFAYGVMTSTNLPLSITPFEALVEEEAKDVVTVVARKIAESCVELRGAKGNRLCLYFSDAKTEATSPNIALEDFCDAASAALPVEHADDVRRFLYRTLSIQIAQSHGALFVVQGHRKRLLKKLQDSTALPSALSLAARVIDLKQHKDNEALAKLGSASSLLRGMLWSDGIVVFNDKAEIIAYRAFLKLPSRLSSPIAGGARRRTFEALKGMVGREVEAVFMASQDGQTEFSGKS